MGGLVGGRGLDGPVWAEVELRFRAVKAARPLLAFGADVRVVSPPEGRTDLATVAAEAVACHSGELPAREGAGRASDSPRREAVGHRG